MRTHRSYERRLDRLIHAAETEVRAVLTALPEQIRTKLKDVPICFEPSPTKEMISNGVDPELLGLFVGHEYEESNQYPEVRQIFLFVENIWEEANHDPTDYRAQVRLTLLHEIGHYLGLEEDELGVRGLE
ncbi:MAG: metallopeptidase family protein [Kiritimatiellae bacterium]|nr:metallopeptidase family protein [Kiritimatiellia bacterium]